MTEVNAWECVAGLPGHYGVITRLLPGEEPPRVCELCDTAVRWLHVIDVGETFVHVTNVMNVIAVPGPHRSMAIEVAQVIRRLAPAPSRWKR